MHKYCTDGWEDSLPDSFLYWLKNLEHNWEAANIKGRNIERLTGVPQNNNVFPLVITSPSMLTIGEKVICFVRDDESLRKHIMEILDESRSN
jgi:hypothetical protein